jgi:hypothetical protein
MVMIKKVERSREEGEEKKLQMYLNIHPSKIKTN